MKNPPPSSLPPQFPHHVTRLIHQDHCRWQKGYQWTPPFFFLFFLPGRRWCCPPILNDWKQGEQRDTKTRRERERMNESYAEGREKGNRVSALRALGWQTGSGVYYVYEWEGGDTLSLCPSPPLWYTPFPRPGVSVLGSCEAVAPYIDVDVSLCFFWQRFLLHSWQSGER